MRGSWIWTKRCASAVSMVVVLGLVGCGSDPGGGDGSGGSPPAASSSTDAEPTTQPNLETLDYGLALYSRQDLQNLIPADWKAQDDADMAGLLLRSQCAQRSTEPSAVAGHLLEHLDADQTISATTSVQAFASPEDALVAFNGVRDIAQACTGYADGGDTFERITTPLHQDAGEDSFSFWAAKTDTGLVVADHFVIQGPFVFDVRFAISASSSIHPGIAATIADEASRKFVSWAEDQS